MSEKRRGLGRGLGALIPSGPAPTPRTGDRPVDVFFPERDQGAGQGGDGFTGNHGADEDSASQSPSGGPSAEVAPDAPQPAAPAETADGPSDAATPPNGSRPEDAADRGAAEPDGLVPVPGAHFAEVPVTRITPNPRQPRTVFDEEALAELVHSVREIGVLQPVVVRPVGSDEDGPRYELVMGERRWRATQEAGLESIPAIVRETTDDDLLRDALLENLHRSQLNPLEEAAAYQQLLEDFGCTHDELAGRIGRSRPQISNTLRLMKLPPLVQRRVAAGVLSAGHARALLGLADGAAMERLAQRIVAEGLSVRATEEIVALGGDDAPEPARRRPRAGERHGALDELATRLSDRLDTRVRIALGQRKGKLTVEFASVEDLNRILGELAPDVPGVFRSN